MSGALKHWPRLQCAVITDGDVTSHLRKGGESGVPEYLPNVSNIAG